MNTPKRFDDAIRKLYNAFHENRLNPECCVQCAVGNILDNNESWTHLTDRHGSGQLTYVGRVNQALGKRFGGYTPEELLLIENTFLQGCGYQLPLTPCSKKPANRLDKNRQLDGLCAVVELLCALDGIPNIIQYSRLFQFENDRPVYRLEPTEA